MSVSGLVFAAFTFTVAFSLVAALMTASRTAAVAGWISGAARGVASAAAPGRYAGLGGELLAATGKIQEAVPSLGRLSAKMHARASVWLGADDPGSASWLAVREACAFCAGALFWWLGGGFLPGACAGIAAFFAPDFFARARYEARQAKIRSEMPDVLDLLTLCLEAGLSLDASFHHVAGKYRGGLLQAAISTMLGEVRFGMARHEAWEGMARRLGNPELSEVVGALVQADMMGTGLAAALRGLAEQIRSRLRQRAEEAAHKAPVRLLFPLALFIFPAIFVVLLGPVFLQILGAVQ